MTPIPALPTNLWRSLFVAVIGFAAGTARLSAMETVALPVGSNHQAIVNAHPPGTHYLIASGIHRGVSIVPKDGDIISGEPGAVLNGCLVLEEWQPEGDFWWHTAPVIAPQVSPNGVECADPLCIQSQDFYLDNVRLKPVGSLEALISPDQWFFDRTNGRVSLRVNPTGRLAEFGGPSRTAIECAPPGGPRVNDVVIEDLTIEKYPSPPQVGAVRLATGIIRRCAVVSSHSYGVQLIPGAGQVIDCYIADNGMCGIGGTGIGAIIEGNEIAHNVWPLFAGLPWDNGGVKVAGNSNTIFRRNYIHSNNGPGLWWDIKTTQMVVEDNIIESNHWEGVLMEISQNAVIRRNICRWNGVLHRRALWGAQICVQNGSSAHIHNNYLETGPDISSRWGSRQGIIVINQVDRAFDETYYNGKFDAGNILVEENLHVMPNGGHNGVDYGTLGWSTYDDFLNAGFVWRNNRYLVGQPLDHRWSWRLLPNWDSTVGQWLVWETWSPLQDFGSTFEATGPHDYPPTGISQHALIKATTGHDYPVLKAALTRRPPMSPADRDGDQLPDEWERQYTTTPEDLAGDRDSDSDGLTDSAELTANTHPLNPDTDEDGLNDAWELTQALDPLVYDSHLDADGDGRSALEEREDRTSLTIAEPANLPAPASALSFWLSPTSDLVTDPEGVLTTWHAGGPERLKIGWFGGPEIAGTSPTGVPMINPGDMLLVPGADRRWGTLQNGFTLTFAFQPTSIDISRAWSAVMSNETYREEGFRIRMESGYLIFSSGQSGGSLSIAGHTRLTAGRIHLITVTVAPSGQGGALYLDGRLEASTPAGIVIPSRSALMLGNTNGVAPQPGNFADVVAFNRQLSHHERQSVEAFLKKKLLDGLAPAADRDQDGLPDAWEVANNLDTLTPNSLDDPDADGAPNLAELERGLNPRGPDSDGDQLPDGWEITHGTDPLTDDAAGDPDEDGLTNLDEFRGRSDPRVADIDPTFLPFHRIRLWWRADHGLDPSLAGGWIRWRDSAAANHPGLPPESQIITAAATPWAGRSVPALSDHPVTSDGPVSVATVSHSPGLTLVLAVRPTAAPAQPPEFKRLFSFDSLIVGVAGEHLVLRSPDGTLTAQAAQPLPAGPFILTCLAGAPNEPARLLVNGTSVVQLDGVGPVSQSSFSLGGPTHWPADVAEVILHAGVLQAIDRRFTESVLAGKWMAAVPMAGDADGDGLPNWWEHQSGTDPRATGNPDGAGDSDWDGESNAAAFAAGRPGFIWQDADQDLMHDGWESAHGLDPAVADDTLDPDLDGIPNGLEHALLSHPKSVDPIPPWQIGPGNPPTSASATLALQVSQRSWSRRAHWESSPTIASDSWQRLPTGRLSARGPDSVSIEILSVGTGPDGSPGIAFLRLALLPE